MVRETEDKKENLEVDYEARSRYDLEDWLRL
jgi:hypothetical protein